MNPNTVNGWIAALPDYWPIFRHWVLPHPHGYRQSWTIYVRKDGPWTEFTKPLLLEVTNTSVLQFADKWQDPLREVENAEIKLLRGKYLTPDELSFLLDGWLNIRLIPTYFGGEDSTASSQMGLQTWGQEAELSMRWFNNATHEGWEEILPWAYRLRQYLANLLDQSESMNLSSQ